MKSLFLIASFFLLPLLMAQTPNSVTASQFGFDPADATMCLQKAIDSGAAEVIVDKQKTPWIIRPVKLRSDLTLRFADGVRVEAKRGEFRGTEECLFDATEVKNLKLLCDGRAELVMHKKDYLDKKKYSRSEHRHILNIMDSHNVTVENLTLRASGGDGIYIGARSRKDDQSFSSSITLKNVICEENLRQGMSVISVKGLFATGCEFNTTRGLPPEAGIDFEPNSPRQHLEKIVLENCKFLNNYYSGINISSNISHPVDITVRNCEIVCDGSAHSHALTFLTLREHESGKGEARFENVSIRNAGSDVFLFSRFDADNNYKVTLKNIDVQSAAKCHLPPLYLTTPMMNAKEYGNASFENVKLTGFAGQQPAFFTILRSGSAPGRMTGLMQLNGKEFSLDKFCSDNAIPEFKDHFDAADFRPPAGKAEKNPASPCFRNDLRVAIWADAGEKVEFTAEFTALKANGSRLAVQNKKINLTFPDGTKKTVGSYTLKKQRINLVPVQFTASRAGLYRIGFAVPPKVLLRILPAKNLRWGVMPEDGTFEIFRYGKTDTDLRDFYFEVPQGTRSFKLHLQGTSGESFRAKLKDASGTMVYELPKITSTFHKQFDNPVPGIWQLSLDRRVEDLCFALSGELPFIFTSSPALLPRAGKKQTQSSAARARYEAAPLWLSTDDTGIQRAIRQLFGRSVVKKAADAKGAVIVQKGKAPAPGSLQALQKKKLPVLIDIRNFAAWKSLACQELSAQAVVEQEQPLFPGFAAGVALPRASADKKLAGIARAKLPQGTKVLAGDKENAFVFQWENFYVIDFAGIEEPDVKDHGSVYKYAPVVALFGNKPRFSEYYPVRFHYEELLGEMKKIAQEYPAFTYKEEGRACDGNAISSLNIGNPEGPLYLFYAAVHGGEWENGYGLLSFAKRLARGEFAKFADLNRVQFKIIPNWNPYAYTKICRKNINSVDINRQSDHNWAAYSRDKNHDGKYDKRDNTWKGDAPWSEPEAKIYKKILDETASKRILTVDFHANSGVSDNPIAFFAPNKQETETRARAWQKLVSERIADRYYIKQDGGKLPIPYRFKPMRAEGDSPTLVNSAMKHGDALLIELIGYNKKGSILTAMNSDLVCEALLAALECWPAK